MKNRIVLFMVSLFAVVGCDDYTLTPNFEGSINTEDVWTNPVYAEGVLLQAYAALPETNAHYEDNFLDVATDNALSNGYTTEIANMHTGGWRVENNPIGRWNEWYRQIRNVNLWIENGQDAPYKRDDLDYSKQYSRRLYGEAMFLRAWYTFNLLQVYGGYVGQELMGVPMYTSVQQQDTEIVPRATYADCVAAIVADCDTAAAILPKKYDQTGGLAYSAEIGRANAIAAAALKSRVLLYAASEYYNPTDDQQKWEDAAQAAYVAMDMFGATLPKFLEVKKGVLKIYIDKMYTDIDHAELIMARLQESNSRLENSNKMPSELGKGRTSPSQNLVDAFGDKNGYPITHASTVYDPLEPYQNRDPRFDLFIRYNTDKVQTYLGGKDAENSVSETTRTSYFLKKWLTLSTNLEESGSKGNHVFPLFRKGEVFLNFAEAANRAWGPTDDRCGMSAQAAINALRKRSNLTDASFVNSLLTVPEFETLVRNERRVELCFEDHRFFDLRRWQLPLNEPIQKAVITMAADSTFGYAYEVAVNPVFESHMYAAPIPASEVYKGLEQNEGW